VCVCECVHVCVCKRVNVDVCKEAMINGLVGIHSMHSCIVHVQVLSLDSGLTPCIYFFLSTTL